VVGDHALMWAPEHLRSKPPNPTSASRRSEIA
jgi:hypothetical protein